MANVEQIEFALRFCAKSVTCNYVTANVKRLFVLEKSLFSLIQDKNRICDA